LATKHAKSCPSGESRNPEKHWMPDQVRHDVIGINYYQSNNIKKIYKYVNFDDMANILEK
jgi:hypothetical protein